MSHANWSQDRVVFMPLTFVAFFIGSYALEQNSHILLIVYVAFAIHNLMHLCVANVSWYFIPFHFIFYNTE